MYKVSSTLFTILQPSFVLIIFLLAPRVAAWDCTSLTSLSLYNVTITDVIHLTAGSISNASADPTRFTPT